MANTKISALTGASTPLTGTEVLPIVQSSATVNVAVSNLTAGRSVSMKDLTITGTGYVVTITAASALRKAGSIGNTGGTVDFGVESSAGGALFTYAGAYTGNIGTSGATDFNICANGNVVATAKTGGDFSMRNGNVVIATSGKGIDFSATAGTGTSELFADYEEGTWTPNQGSGLAVVGTFSSSGTYTKIGRTVFVTGKLSGSTSISTPTGDIITTNLPFTSLNAGSTGMGNMTNNSLNVTSSTWVNINTTTLYGNVTIAATTSVFFTAVYQT